MLGFEPVTIGKLYVRQHAVLLRVRLGDSIETCTVATSVLGLMAAIKLFAKHYGPRR